MKLLLLPATLLLAPLAAACTGVVIAAGSEIQDVIDRNAPGVTYCIEPGLYRLNRTIVPRAGDRLTGARGVLLSGARLIAKWEKRDAVWVATGQTQRSPLSWKPEWPEIADPAARYNEDVFLDGRPLKRVLSLAEAGPGKFFFDYDRATIAIGDNPEGHSVECGATEAAIDSRAPGVVISGLTVEKFTLRGISVAGPNSVVEKNEVRYVHGSGIRFGTRCRILNNYVHHNGKYGMNGGGQDALLEGNELAFNNAAAYRTKRGGGCWDAGATKFAMSTGLIVRNNYSHDNYCDGFWSDIDNIGTVYEGNRIENNYRHGIFLEIGYAATIRNNQIQGNMSAGIYINSSSEQDIYGNTIAANGAGTPDNGLAIPDGTRGGVLIIQQNRGSGRYGERLARDNRVHDNTIVMNAGATGCSSKQGNRNVFSQNNKFYGNRYSVADPAGAWWSWDGGLKTWSEWRALGQDAAGSLASRRQP